MLEEKRLRDALERARAKFHGLSCAVALHLRSEDRLDLEGLLEILREGNRQCADALGYRGTEGLKADEARTALGRSLGSA